MHIIIYYFLSLIQVICGSGSIVALLSDAIQISIGFMLFLFFVGFIQSMTKKPHGT